MVHALGEIHRVLAPGGTLVDARPDSRVLAYVERRRRRRSQRFGIVRTRAEEMRADRASDAAIAEVVRHGLFAVRRRGRFWHEVSFDSLGDVRAYLVDHLRFAPRASWVVDAATRRRYAEEPFVIRRAVRFGVLEALPGKPAA